MVPFRACPGGSSRAVSLVEVIVVIAVIGIMAAIVLPIISNVLPASSSATAERNLSYLNAAVLSFNQANWELVLTTSSGSDDEQAIFESLRYRNPANPSPGSPYLPATTIFSATSDTTVPRARWNGRMFEMLDAGTAGTGIDLLNMSGPASEPYMTNAPVPAS